MGCMGRYMVCSGICITSEQKVAELQSEVSYVCYVYLAAATAEHKYTCTKLLYNMQQVRQTQSFEAGIPPRICNIYL